MCFIFYRILIFPVPSLNERAAISSCISMCWLPRPPTTAIHCVGWLYFSPLSVSISVSRFGLVPTLLSPTLALSTSLAIYQVNSRMKRVWRPGIPKGVAAPTAAAAAAAPAKRSTSFCKHLMRARAVLKGIKMNWMKIEIENEITCEKERKSRQYTKNNTHNTKSKRNPLHIKRTRMNRARDWGNGALNSRQRLSNTNENTRIRIRIRWVACLFTDVCAQIY